MTERLTQRNEHGVVGTPHPIFLQDAIDKLAYYEDLEEQGRLIELPCEEGDTVWELYQSAYKMWDVWPKGFDYADISQLGKTVFLTREEAEAALKVSENNV